MYAHQVKGLPALDGDAHLCNSDPEDLLSSRSTQIPKWMDKGYRNTVKIIKYSHLQQTQALEVVQRRTVLWPKDNTVDENRMRLQANLQGKGANTVFDDKEQMRWSSPAGHHEETVICATPL